MSDAFDVIAPELKTERLSLRRLSIADAPAIFVYASDPEVAKYTLWPAHKSEEFTRGFLSLLAQPMFLSWVIVPLGSEKPIGMVFFHSLSRSHRKAEIAFNLAREHWKKGIVTEATEAALDFMFGQLVLNRIEATCMPANAAAKRVLEKVGMKQEGTMRRSHIRYGSDVAHDMDLFSVLKDDRRH